MKKILALLLALVMMFALVAACEVETEEPDPTPTPVPSGGNTVETTGTEDVMDEEYDPYKDPRNALAYDDPAAGLSRQELVEHYGLVWEGEPEDITFTIAIGSAGKPPAEGNKVIERLYQLTGVRVEFDFISPAQANEWFGTRIASGEYPDFISGSAASVRSMLVEADSFVALDDYLPNYPNLWKHYEDYLDGLRQFSSDNNSVRILEIWGRNYYLDDGIDSDHLDEYNGPAWWIQKDVIKFNDYVAPTTLEEYFDLLARYYAANPEIDGQPTLPFEVYAFSDSNYVMRNPPQHLVGMRNEGDAVVVSTDPFEVEIYDNKWYAKEYYQTLNKAFKDGLINPATFTRITDEYNSVISQGRVLGFFEQQWNIQTAENVLIADDNLARTYVPLGLTLPGYESNLYYKGVFSPSGNGIGITQSCQDVERALKFMDQLLTPEVHTLLYWGFEGEDFYIDENGRYRRTPAQKANWDNNDWRTENAGDTLLAQFPKIQGRLPNGNAWNSGSQPEERMENAKAYDIEFYSHFPFTRRDGFLTYGEDPGYPELWSVREAIKSSNKEFNDLFNALKEIGERYIADLIQADDFEAAWEEYVARYEEVDYKRFEQILAEETSKLMYEVK